MCQNHSRCATGYIGHYIALEHNRFVRLNRVKLRTASKLSTLLLLHKPYYPPGPPPDNNIQHDII